MRDWQTVLNADHPMGYTPTSEARKWLRAARILMSAGGATPALLNMREPLSIDMLKSGRVKFKTDPISFC